MCAVSKRQCLGPVVCRVGHYLRNDRVKRTPRSASVKVFYFLVLLHGHIVFLGYQKWLGCYEWASILLDSLTTFQSGDFLLPRKHSSVFTVIISCLPGSIQLNQLLCFDLIRFLQHFPLCVETTTVTALTISLLSEWYCVLIINVTLLAIFVKRLTMMTGWLENVHASLTFYRCTPVRHLDSNQTQLK